MVQPIIYNAHFIQLLLAVEFEITSSFFVYSHQFFIRISSAVCTSRISLDLNFQVSVNRKLLQLIPVRDFESAVKFGEERT